jgi:hypothetical protein
MKLQIQDDMTVAALQAEFNAMFPYLKLEVIIGPAKGAVNKYMPLRQCRRQHNEGDFDVQPQERLIDFVDRLKKEYGLTVEVYRKSGNLWIATSLSSTWTLQRQNNEGLEINSYMSD